MIATRAPRLLHSGRSWRRCGRRQRPAWNSCSRSIIHTAVDREDDFVGGGGQQQRSLQGPGGDPEIMSFLVPRLPCRCIHAELLGAPETESLRLRVLPRSCL